MGTPGDTAVVTSRGRIGLIVPCDLTLDAEYPRYLPEEATVHLTRTGFHAGDLDLDFILGVSSPSEIAYAARSLTKIAPGVISFACTSGSFVLGLDGESRIRTLMEDAGTAVAQTTSGALLDALAALGIERIGLGTPYTESVGARLGSFLTEAGYHVTGVINMELHDVIGPVADDAVIDLARQATAGRPEAVFLACTGVPTIDLIAPLEADLGMPVLTANQVTMWAALGSIGMRSPLVSQRLLGIGWQSHQA